MAGTGEQQTPRATDTAVRNWLRRERREGTRHAARHGLVAKDARGEKGGGRCARVERPRVAAERRSDDSLDVACIVRRAARRGDETIGVGYERTARYRWQRLEPARGDRGTELGVDVERDERDTETARRAKEWDVPANNTNSPLGRCPL